MGIALIMLMAGFIKICSVHTPSSNPKLPPPKPLPGTEQRVFRNLQYPSLVSTWARPCSCQDFWWHPVWLKKHSHDNRGYTIHCWLLLARLFSESSVVCFVFSLRYTEEEATAARKPAATGPAALPSAQAELSDGTDETLRDVTLVLLCAFKRSTSLQRVTF